MKVDSYHQRNLKNIEPRQTSTLWRDDRANWVKDWLNHSNPDYNAKQPKVLTAIFQVKQFLSERGHHENLHKGREHARRILQQELWIIGLQKEIREIQSRCINNRHTNDNPIYPQMAELPRERLDEQLFPFTHTGVEYFGPNEVMFIRIFSKNWAASLTV